MRILLVSNLYPPYWVGGYEQIASWVAEGLAGRGHEVRVLTGRGPAFEGRREIHGVLDLDLADLQRRYFDGPGRPVGLGSAVRRHVFSLANYRAARRLLHEFPADLVSFWNPALVTHAPLLAARRAGVPAVVHFSDTAANVFRNPHAPDFPWRLHGAAAWAVDRLLGLARPRALIVPSAFLREKLVREGLPEARVEVLRWPVEPTASARAVARNGTPGTRFLFVGTLIPEKGPDVLVSAFREAVERRPDLCLSLVGEGPPAFRARLEQEARGLPVRFCGRLDRAAVVAAYESHDVLVFPSVWDEPFAVVPLEAMAMGLAVIATSAGGTPEAVAHETTGLLVPPSDPQALAGAMLRLSQDPALAGRLARAGQAWARREQGFDVFLGRLEALYARAALGRR